MVYERVVLTCWGFELVDGRDCLMLRVFLSAVYCNQE